MNSVYLSLINLCAVSFSFTFSFRGYLVSSAQGQEWVCTHNMSGHGIGCQAVHTVFPQLERARSIYCRLAPRGVVFEGALWWRARSLYWIQTHRYQAIQPHSQGTSTQNSIHLSPQTLLHLTSKLCFNSKLCFSWKLCFPLLHFKSLLHFTSIFAPPHHNLCSTSPHSLLHLLHLSTNPLIAKVVWILG